MNKSKHVHIDEINYAGQYVNENTGVYLSLWMFAQSKADALANEVEYYKNEYLSLRLKELKEMPYKDYLNTSEWKAKRKKALKSADYKCQLCHADNVELNVHHNNYERRGEEKSDDLIVLCKKCHAKHHDKD